MNITITINTDNAAFEYQAGLEVARILRDLARQVQNWPGRNKFRLSCMDINGNKVGSLEVKP